MNSRQNPLYWSFGLGTWFATQVRVSVLFPVVILLFCWNLGLQLGLAFSAVLFCSVLLHEFGHIMAARHTGGRGEQILIWPLGGLAFVEPARHFQSQFLTVLAGPVVNLMLCLLTLPAVLYSAHATTVWNPLVLPMAELSPNLVSDLLVLTFSVNWLLLLLNLVPIYPLDGGRLVQSWLSLHWGQTSAAEVSIRIGIVAAIGLGIIGFMANATWLLGAACLFFVMALLETQRIQVGEMYDDSFMGYDFSQGYTSLEKSQPPAVETKPSLFQQWKTRRKAEKLRRQQELEQQAESQLDGILAKLHEQGMAGLTESEKKLLQRASARYRGKGKQGE